MIRWTPSIGGVVLSLAMTASPALADRMGGESPFPSRYADYYEISSRDGMLIGAEGRTGDSMRYGGKKVWRGPGSATVLVRERNNKGLVMGTIRTKGHTYTVLMDTFGGDRTYQSGGIARFVNLHGFTERGAPPAKDVRVSRRVGQPMYGVERRTSAARQLQMSLYAH